MGKEIENWESRDLEYIWHPAAQMKDYEELPPMVIERAKGVWLYDVHGKKYLDIISSWWCNLFGHCNPIINQGRRDDVPKGLEATRLSAVGGVLAAVLGDSVAGGRQRISRVRVRVQLGHRILGDDGAQQGAGQCARGNVLHLDPLPGDAAVPG